MSLPLPLLGAPASATKKSPPRTRSGTSGEFSSDGGLEGLGLFGNQYGKEVGVRILPIAPKDLCCGAIGVVGKKMCIKQLGTCTTQSHAQTKAVISTVSGAPAGDPGDGLFIDDKEGETVYCLNVLPLSLLPEGPELYKGERRTPTAWGELFRALAKRPAPSPAEEDTIKEMVDSHEKLMESPFKKARPNSPGEEIEIEFLADDKETKDVELKLAHLASLIGDTNESESPESIFGQLERLSAVVNDKSLTQEEKIALGTLMAWIPKFGSNLELLKQATHEEMTKSILPYLQPMLDWFTHWTPKDANGALGPIAGTLEAKILTMEGNIKRVSQQLNNKATQPLFGSPGTTPKPVFGAPSAGLAMASPATANLKPLEDRMDRMQRQMDGIQEQLSGEQINIAGQWFRSKVELEAWMKTHMKDEDLYICFADPSCLLNMGSQTGGDNRDAMAFKSDSRKAGYGDGYVGLAELSFNFALPVMFGKETGKVGSRDDRVLPGLKSPEQWDAPNEFSGLKHEANRQLKEVDRVLQNYLHSDLMSPEARLVAIECLSRSKLFIAGLFNWMTNTYQFGIRGNRPSAPLWRYISHCVRAVFNKLHDAREAGRVPKATSCDRLWGFLQGIRVAGEFFDAKYSGHPVLSHVLNVHLHDQAVMKEQLEDRLKAMEDAHKKSIKAVEEIAKKAQDKANTANQAAQRALSKN